MNLGKALQILRLNSQATRSDVKQAYRRLAAQWHPDLHTHNPKVGPTAAKKMQELNDAYTFALNCLPPLPPEGSKAKTLPPTARFNQRLCIFLLAATICLTLITLLFFLYNSPSLDPRSAFSPHQAQPTATDQARVRFRADDFHHFHRKTLKEAQLNLATIGYPTGKIDGIFGPQSLAAIQSFRSDFSLLSTIDTAEDMLLVLAAHAQLATAHPEWRSIIQSEDFYSWLTGSNIDIERQQKGFNTASQLTQLFARYTFTTTMPAVQPLPLTELLWQDAPYTIVKTITIVGLETNRQHSFIKLIAADSEQELIYGFIRKGEQLTIPWPDKKCQLRLASGKQWYGKRFLFGPETKYSIITVDQTNSAKNITLDLSSLVNSTGARPENSVHLF